MATLNCFPATCAAQWWLSQHFWEAPDVLPARHPKKTKTHQHLDSKAPLVNLCACFKHNNHLNQAYDSWFLRCFWRSPANYVSIPCPRMPQWNFSNHKVQSQKSGPAPWTAHVEGCSPGCTPSFHETLNRPFFLRRLKVIWVAWIPFASLSTYRVLSILLNIWSYSIDRLLKLCKVGQFSSKSSWNAWVTAVGHCLCESCDLIAQLLDQQPKACLPECFVKKNPSRNS